jgi:hypothetical protein
LARASICVAVCAALCIVAGSASASFPGRNGTIAYSWIGESAYRAGPTETSIRSVDPRSRAVRVLWDCPLRSDAGVPYTDCSVGSPRVSPDGSLVAFTITRVTPDFTGRPWRFDPGIATIAADGSSPQERATAQRYLNVSWSPAGNRLLLERQLTDTGPLGENAIFLATRDLAELGQATPDLSTGADWSSRGEIAFVKYRDANCLPDCGDIFITRIGGTPRRLTYRGGSGTSWSPGGTKLAFVRQSRGLLNLFVVRRSGRGLRRLTRNGAYAPVWSPDGKWIAFNHEGDLEVIRTNGRGRHRLVNGTFSPGLGEGTQVAALDWQALPPR